MVCERKTSRWLFDFEFCGTVYLAISFKCANCRSNSQIAKISSSIERNFKHQSQFPTFSSLFESWTQHNNNVNCLFFCFFDSSTSGNFAEYFRIHLRWNFFCHWKRMDRYYRASQQFTDYFEFMHEFLHIFAVWESLSAFSSKKIRDLLFEKQRQTCSVRRKFVRNFNSDGKFRLQ